MKYLKILGVMGLVALAGVYFASPYYVTARIAAAAQARDAEKVSEYIDYVALRGSIKKQITEQANAMLAQQEAIGAGMGIPPAVADAMRERIMARVTDTIVEKAVSPEGLQQVMEREIERIKGDKTSGVAPEMSSVEYESDYEGLNRFRVSITTDANGQAMENPPYVVMTRRGFAVWRIVDVRLPANGE